MPVAAAADGRAFNIGLWAELSGGRPPLIGSRLHRGVLFARWSVTMDRILNPEATPPPVRRCYRPFSKKDNNPAD